MYHSYCELFYHLVWGTKNHEPLINSEIKNMLINFLTRKAISLKCRVFAMNCVCDHIHLLLAIPPDLAVSKAINLLKGSSSHMLKQSGHTFYWQEGMEHLHCENLIWKQFKNILPIRKNTMVAERLIRRWN